MTMRNSKEIELLKKEVEAQLSWGEAAQWHSKMFDELSEKVFASTNVMLSVATLKRFFGVVNHDGSPSITTLDALSRFVGKDNWRAFKTSFPAKKSRPRPPRKSIYVTIGFVLALVTISLIGNKRPEVVINASEFSFKSKVLSTEYPNSVVFDFQIPNTLRADSLHIQQYWDPTKTISIHKDQTQATGIYYFPGYFRAKLMVDGQAAKSHDLFLKSAGWLGMIEYEETPKYFRPEIAGGGIVFPEEIQNEIIAKERPVVSSFHFIDDLGSISGDDFIFSTTIKTAFDDRWAVCQAMNIYFIGSTGAMIVPFSKIGCSSDNDLMLNDVYLSGKEHDLSSLSANFEDPVELTIRVVEKNVSITIDDIKVYEKEYKQSMGKLVGMRFKFKGLGEVITHDLTNASNEKVL